MRQPPVGTVASPGGRAPTPLPPMTFESVELTDWRDVHDLADMLPSGLYVFRGQEDSAWPLSTSLERVLLRDRPGTRYRPDSGLSWATTTERWMVHEFARRHALYDPTAPRPEGPFEWLALMQHHGAPTRLLDASESIYVAAYFALATAPAESAVWAVSRYNLQRRAFAHLGLDYDPARALKDDVNRHHVALVNEAFGAHEPEDAVPGVVDCGPTVANRRLSLQQGVFLVPTVARARFEANLAATFGAPSWPEPTPTDLAGLARRHRAFLDTDARDERTDLLADIVRVHIGPGLRRDALRSLTRMNVTAESLFGGLDGLARSVYQRAAQS